MQPKSQYEGPESQLEATELSQEHTEFEGPELQIVGLKLDTKDHDEASGTSSKSKVPMLARYVKSYYAPNHIIGDKLDGKMTRNKLKGTCFLT